MKKITTLALSLLSAGLIGCGTPQDAPVGTLASGLTTTESQAVYQKAWCWTRYLGASNRAACVANFPSGVTLADLSNPYSFLTQLDAVMLADYAATVDSAQFTHQEGLDAVDESLQLLTDIRTGFTSTINISAGLYCINGDSFE